MKMYFSKLAKVLLAGVVFVAVGCTDYKDDIDSINDKLENDVIAGMIEPLKADLEKAVADLEAAQAALKSELTTKHDADVKTLKDADAALDGKIAAANQSILDLQAALAAEKAALEAAIEAAKKASVDGDAALKADLEKQIADLTTKHNDDIAALQKAMQDNVAAVEAQFKVVADQVAALQLKDTELEAALAKQAEDIAALGKKVDDNYNALTDALAAAQEALSKDIATVADDLKTLTATVTEIEGDLVNHLKEYAEYQVLVNGKLAELEAAHNALVAIVENLEENVIPAMKEQIEENAKLANQNAADIATNKELFDQFKEAATKTHEQLFAADEELTKAIELLDGKVDDLQAYANTIKDLVDEHYEAFQQYQKDTNASIEDLIAKHNAQAEVLTQLQKDLEAEIAAREQGDAALQTLVDDLKARVAVLEAGLAELKAAHEALATDYEAFKKQISLSLINSINALQEQMALNNAAIYGTIADLQVQHNADVAALKEADKKLHKSIENLAITLDKAIKAEAEARKNADAALQDQIDSILAMIQSVVYVPEYTDGKATINYAALEGKPVEGVSTMIYQVYPAECADALALIDAEKLAEHLSFDLTDELKVRNVANGPKLTVVGVETVDGKPGQIAVSFKASNLGASFYNHEVEYATSLHIVYGDADLSSCYTNLVCAEEPVEISVKILMPTLDDKVVDITNNEHYETYELVYNDVTTEVSFLNGHIIAFSIDGTNYYNDDEFTVQTGYELLRYKKDTDSKAEAHYSREFNFDGYFMMYFVSANEGVKNAFIAPSWESYKKARLAEPNAELIGTSYNVVYQYSVGAEKYTAGADVLITKEKATANLTPAESLVATWNYVEDAEVDADKLVNGDAATLYYQRDLKLDLTAAVTEKLPEDTELADVLVSAPTSVKVNGVDATEMVSFSKDAEGNVVLNFSHFAWNKEYTVVVKYSLQNVDVEATFAVKTVDRDRKTPVKVEQTFDGYVFAKDYAFAAFDGVAPEMAINKVYTDVAALYDLTGIEEAAYLKEVFVTNAPYAVEDVIAPALAPQMTLDYLFNAAGDKVSVDYAYDAWTEIPMEVTYTKNLNLWYGQEVELVVKLVITKPTNFNFIFSDYYVTNTGSRLESQVYPYYAPELPTTALTTFDVQKVDMDKAFNIVNNGTIMSAKEIADAGLVAEFKLEETYDFSKYNAQFSDPTMQRRLEFEGNKLAYYADVEEAPVTGTLYLVNSNGSKLALETNFDTNDQYKNYVVKKYDPITAPTQPEVQKVKVTSATYYVKNVLELISVYDYRNGFQNYPLISDGMFVVGDGKNGFGTLDVNGTPVGVSVVDLYTINYVWSDSAISADMAKILSFSKQTGELVLDNSAQIKLEKPVLYTVTLTIQTVWGEHVVNVPFEFYQPTAEENQNADKE